MLRNIRTLWQITREAKLSRPRMDDLVSKRMRSVLNSAYMHVPYYRALMQGVGYNPLHDYQGPGDIRYLPVTNKRILKQTPVHELVKEGQYPLLDGYAMDHTSGSSGVPFTVYKDHRERAVTIAKWLRVLFLNGYVPTDKVLSFTSPARIQEGRSVVQRFGLFRRLPVNYLQSPADFVDAIINYQPKVIYGTRSCFDLVAQELKSRMIKLHDLKIAIAVGETIGENSRRLCREYLGINMTEVYGSVEMGVMAYETGARDGMHLSEGLTYFEFLDAEGNPARPGEPARVIVTDIVNKLMPFIRYEQGDLCIYREVTESDGSPGIRIERVIGREDDIVILPDGSKRIFNRFMNIMDAFTSIEQYRIIQKEFDLFHVLIIADSSYLQRILPELKAGLMKDWPAKMRFEISRVDHIAPDPNGKSRLFISEIAD